MVRARSKATLLMPHRSTIGTFSTFWKTRHFVARAHTRERIKIRLFQSFYGVPWVGRWFG